MTRCRFDAPGRVLGVLLLLLPCAALAASQVDPQLFSGMKWRQVGPFRGGRVVAVSGVPGDPATWYFGAVAGGVWKSTNAGSTWQPVFDEQKIASIGAIAVADSDHNIIYVGTGEACPRGNISYGDGVYKSLDAGRTWQHLGLRDTRHIGAIVVDPRNPDVVFVAALGHAFGPNDERGIFRTGDGGKTWQRVLFRDRDSGGIDVVLDPRHPNTPFASLWQMRRGPWGFSKNGRGAGRGRGEISGGARSFKKKKRILRNFRRHSTERECLHSVFLFDLSLIYKVSIVRYSCAPRLSQLVSVTVHSSCMSLSTAV